MTTLMRKNILRATLCFLINLFISLNALSDNYNLPDLGSPSALTPTTEIQIGKEFMQMVRHEVPIVYDPLIEDYIRQLGYRLVSHTGTVGNHFYFFVINTLTINAFSGPNGYTGVDSGLITATQNESELAAVMAHEIAHTTQGHVARGIYEGKGLWFITLGAMLAAVAAGAASKNGDVAVAGAAAASAGGTANMLAFSRSYEQEADRVGMDTLYAAGFNPYGMPRFFERMEQLTLSDDSDLMGLLSTHPVTRDRIADAENRAAQYPKKTYQSSQMYYLIQARIRALYTSYPNQAVNYFQAQLNNNSYQNKTATEYGYALALMRNYQYGQSIAILSKLMKQYPNQVIYPMALANVYTNEKSYPFALKLLKENYQLYPDYRPLQVQYAVTLWSAGNYRNAIQLLQNLLMNEPDNLELNELLAKNYADNHQEAEAYQTLAKISLLQGQKKQAVWQLGQALKAKNLSPATRTQIQSQLQSLQQSSHRKPLSLENSKY